VIPPERFASVRIALNEMSEQPWGVRETFPYYPAEEFGYEGGDYHNGAVWPWLNFADAIARCRSVNRRAWTTNRSAWACTRSATSLL